MGDGWETRRRREPGNDWLILNSVKGKKIDKIEISTHHFKGNFPSHCSLQAALYQIKVLLLQLLKVQINGNF